LIEVSSAEKEEIKFHLDVMLTTLRPVGPEGTRGTFSLVLVGEPRVTGTWQAQLGKGGPRGAAHIRSSLDITVWWPKSILVTGEGSGWFGCWLSHVRAWWFIYKVSVTTARFPQG